MNTFNFKALRFGCVEKEILSRCFDRPCFDNSASLTDWVLTIMVLTEGVVAAPTVSINRSPYTCRQFA